MTEATLEKIASGKYAVIFDGVRIGHVARGPQWEAYAKGDAEPVAIEQTRDLAVGVMVRRLGLVRRRSHGQWVEPTASAEEYR